MNNKKDPQARRADRKHQTCSDCNETALCGTDSEGRCKHCSPYWPPQEPS